MLLRRLVSPALNAVGSSCAHRSRPLYRTITAKARKTTDTQPLTPYRGSKRCYGFFRCPKCNRKWESGNSWRDCGQDCKKCDVRVYPYMQKALEKAEGHIDTEKPHEESLCEKCQQLGYNCREYRRRDDDSDYGSDDDSDW